jgi:FMN phosphatase YigB (HAD superfamily)
MIKAVLFDLDDTLLRTNTDHFVERYLASLADLCLKRVPTLASHEVPIDKAIGYAARATVGNLDPTRVNAEVFATTITGLLKLPADAAQKLIEVFQEGAELQSSENVSPIPAARPLIERLLDMGMAVVIATNPLFPPAAVAQRLAWGGLDSPRLPYALVTNIDIMHFTKPNPHYYEEILARIGAEADETIMIGDSFANDIVPAAKAGLNTFWIDWGEAPTSPDIVPEGMGTLDDFAERVAAGWLSALTPRPRTADQVSPRMLGDVAALYGLIDAMNPAYWHAHPDPNEWSPLETVCHLRDSERSVQRPRLQRIAAEDNPFISQPQEPPGPGEHDLTGEDGYAAMRQFWDERCRTLDFLQGLNAEDWNRPARHSIFGPTTLLEMAHFTTRHDHLHLNQLCQTIGRCR